MRIQRTNGLGLVLPASMATRAPPLPRFRGFGGAWEDWCDIHYWTPENNAKCKNCNLVNIPILGPRCTYPDPKTQAGRIARGLSLQSDLDRLGPPPSESTPDVPIPETGDSWFDDNKMLILGGGALIAGVAFLAMRKKGGRMNGYRKSKRRGRRN